MDFDNSWDLLASNSSVGVGGIKLHFLVLVPLIEMRCCYSVFSPPSHGYEVLKNSLILVASAQ
jgi:hypothetical protein